MTGVDAHGLLREQIADVLLLRGGLGSWMPGQIDVVLDDLVAFVEAAIAAARRDALTAAADEMFAEVEGGPGLLRPEVQAWLRQRAAAPVPATPEEPPPAEVSIYEPHAFVGNLKRGILWCCCGLTEMHPIHSGEAGA